MWFLPYDNYTIVTGLSPREVRYRLDSIIEPRIWFRTPFLRSRKPYEGKFEGAHFNITPIIHYRNSFLPVIWGNIKPRNPGTIIHLTMHPRPFVIAFVGLISAIIGAALFKGVIEYLGTLNQGSSTDSVILMRILALAGFLALST